MFSNYLTLYTNYLYNFSQNISLLSVFIELDTFSQIIFDLSEIIQHYLILVYWVNNEIIPYIYSNNTLHYPLL